MSIEPKLAERLLTFRTKQGLTQEEVAEKIGVSNKTYSKWETGSTSPDIETLVRLAEAFSVTTDDLLGLSDSRPVSFEEAAQAEVERNLDNPVKTLFRMYEALIRLSHRYLEDEEDKRKWLPEDLGKYPDHPRCVVSVQNAFQMSVCSPAVNFVFALFRSEEDFGWLKNQNMLETMASLSDDGGFTEVSCEPCASFFSVFPEPENGWGEAVGDGEEIRSVFAALAEPSVMKALLFLLSKEDRYLFEPALLTKELGIAASELELVMSGLQRLDMVSESPVVFNKEARKLYYYNQNVKVIPLLLFAKFIRYSKIFRFQSENRQKPLIINHTTSQKKPGQDLEAKI